MDELCVWNSNEREKDRWCMGSAFCRENDRKLEYRFRIIITIIAIVKMEKEHTTGREREREYINHKFLFAYNMCDVRELRINLI